MENRLRGLRGLALGLVVCGWVGSAMGGTPTADFSAEVGAIRPELHSSGFGPTICSQTAQDLEDVKSMGFAFARTHDWALINPNDRVCDWHHIFPLEHLDATKPENYVFAQTDYLLKRTREEAGLDIFFRLGTSIEHSGHKIHFNTLIPKDFDKVAEVFAGTVRHYNRGWANGHNWNIKYWEIWNEPEGVHNMWCPPEGTEGLEGEALKQKRAECQRQFVKFFVTVLKRLKSEFGDEIKVGGPALCVYRDNWFRDILAACKEAGVAPDFISWHGYTKNPMLFNDCAEKGRKLLDSFGFTKCEMIVNEWHYFGQGDYTWEDMQRCSDPAVKQRIWSGPKSHNGIHSAAFTLATLANLQRSKLSQAYYYGCRHSGSWGFKDELQAKYKVFYALQLFGKLVKNYSTVCASTNAGADTLLAVKSADGAKKGLLVVDYGGTNRTIAVDVKGVSAVKGVTLLDYTHDLTPHTAVFKDGRLVLEKPDENSAAFFVEFSSDGSANFSIVESSESTPQTSQTPIIFDTDMLTDFDDVGALACLHALADAGECKILATVSCTRGNASVAAVEVINSHYGRGDLPVGCAKGIGVIGDTGRRDGHKATPAEIAKMMQQGKGGHYKYRKLAADYPQWVKHPDSDDAPDANTVYRRILAAQPDHSVVICSVGFLTNLRRLLETKGDEFSPLDGKALVAKKVKRWVAMALKYPRGKEYNSMMDPESSRIVLENWPTEVVISDFEFGFDIFAGRKLAEQAGPRNPVKDVFAGNIPSRGEIRKDSAKKLRDCFGMGGRSAWDETAVIIAVRGIEPYCHAERGTYRMLGTDGENEWAPGEDGPHLRVQTKISKAQFGHVIDELICRPPRNAK